VHFCSVIIDLFKKSKLYSSPGDMKREIIAHTSRSTKNMTVVAESAIESLDVPIEVVHRS